MKFLSLIPLLFFVACGDVTDNKLEIADSFLKPFELKKENWKQSATRTVFKNQKTGFIVKGNLCLLAKKYPSQFFKLEPLNIDLPSSNQRKEGTYYDALIPLTEKNCKSSLFGYMDLEKSFNDLGLNITIQKLSIESKKPSIPLFIPMEPYAYTIGMHKGQYISGTEKLSFDAFKLLKDHRIQPIKSWLEPYKEESHQNFVDYVLKQSFESPNVPILGEIDKIRTPEQLKNAWFYVADEPTDEELKKVKIELKSLKEKHPNIKTMVTTSFHKGYDIDIYCEVAEYLNDKSIRTFQENNKEIWMYVSCMGHGCGPSRYYSEDPSKRYPVYQDQTNTPDLTIDASGLDPFGLYLLTFKYPLKALLYYNSIEQWNLTEFGVNVLKDMHNFGGNGDGTLIYPDHKLKIPYASLRLKLLREASFLADAIKMTQSKSMIIDNIKSPSDWKFDEKVREEIFSKLSLYIQ